MNLICSDSKILPIGKKRKSISLTPLIDVVFILLMFFMLTSNFTQWRSIDFNSATPAVGEADKEPRFVVLFADLGIALVDSNYAIESHEKILPEHITYFENADSVVLIPEKSADLQSIVSTLDGLKKIGLPSIVLGESLSREELAKLQ